MSTLLLMVAQPPMDSYMETVGAPVYYCVCVPLNLLVFQTACLEYVLASVHEFMST